MITKKQLTKVATRLAIGVAVIAVVYFGYPVMLTASEQAQSTNKSSWGIAKDSVIR